jgi:hypothetical protein
VDHRPHLGQGLDTVLPHRPQHPAHGGRLTVPRGQHGQHEDHRARGPDHELAGASRAEDRRREQQVGEDDDGRERHPVGQLDTGDDQRDAQRDPRRALPQQLYSTQDRERHEPERVAQCHDVLAEAHEDRQPGREDHRAEPEQRDGLQHRHTGARPRAQPLDHRVQAAHHSTSETCPDPSK